MDPSTKTGAALDPAGPNVKASATGSGTAISPVARSPQPAMEKDAGKMHSKVLKLAAESPPAAEADLGTGRKRKQVEIYKPTEAKEQIQFSVKPGKGTKLRDIPNVYYVMNKIRSKDDLIELLHNVMFKRKGKEKGRKQNVLNFSGFSWDADQAVSERAQVIAKLDKAKVAMLHRAMDAFQIPRGAKEEGHKSEKIIRLVDWLMAPCGNDNKKDLANEALVKKAASAKKASATKRKRDPDASAAPKKRSKAADSTSPTAKSSKSKKSKKAAVVNEDGEDSDDDISLAVSVKLPTDKALKAKVKSILASVDVRDFNLRALMEQLNAHYGTDVRSKKPLIKVTAIQYCINNAPEAADSDAEGNSQDQDGNAAVAAEDDNGEGKSDPVDNDGTVQQAASEAVASIPDQQPLQEGADDVKEAKEEAKDVAACDMKETAAEAAMVAADDAVAANDGSD